MVTKIVYALNTVEVGRNCIVTCGIPFDKGEVTSTTQVITEIGARGYDGQFGGSTTPNSGGSWRQKVQWEPFGVPYNDGSYRFGKIQFIGELAAKSWNNGDTKCIIDTHSAGYSNYRAFNWDNTNYNLFADTRFELKINGETAAINGSQLTLVGTPGTEDVVRRYKLFTRPFATMPWIWVELVVDVPNLSGTSTDGSNWWSKVKHANFWFRFGCSYLQRNTGYRSNGLYNEQQSRFFLSDGIYLTIIGQDSCLRFEQYIVNKRDISVSGRPAVEYHLHDHTLAYYKADAITQGGSKMYRGVLFFNTESWIASAEKTFEVSAIAEGWQKYMPPIFADTELPPNVAEPSTSNYRTDWIARINNLLRDGYGRIYPRPHQWNAYGPKPDIAGPGDQGTFGNAYHHNCLYWTMQSSYSAEIPHLVAGIISQGFRPVWQYEQDGTGFTISNYPTAWVWSSRIFNGNGSFGGTSPDWAGIVYLGYGAEQQREGESGREWQGPDRQHASVQVFGIATIISADYFGFEFCKMFGETYAAMIKGRAGYNIIDGWEADRASARTMQSLIPMFYVTNSQEMLKGLAKRYWLGYSILQGWRFGENASIDKLDFIDVVGCYTSNNQVFYNSTHDSTTWPENPGYNRGWLPGNLRPRSPSEAPFFNPWQSGFVAITYYQLYKMFEDLYPDGAWCSITNNDEITLSNPGGNSFPISKTIALSVARDLAATVINHCTWLFGPNSSEGRYIISCAVTASTSLPADSLQRLNECWPVGGTVRGSVTGTTATIWMHQMGDPWEWVSSSNATKFGRLFLKNGSGPGFSTDGVFITEELVCIETGYSSRNYNPDRYAAYANIGWYGMPSYCIDRNGSALFTAGAGANYRKPLTRSQLEETRVGTYWNSYTTVSPIWAMFFRDYGVWQSACATIVIDGLRNNYYVTNDAVNYSLSSLETKTTDIISAAYSIATYEEGYWNQSIWPYLNYKENFRGLNNPNVNISRDVLFISTAITPLHTLTTEYYAETKFNAKPAEAFSYVPAFTVFNQQVTNIDIKPNEVSNYKLGSVKEIRIDTEYSPTSQDLLGSTAVLPENGLIVVVNPVIPIVNVVINLAMDRPLIQLSLPSVDPVPAEVPSDGDLAYRDPTIDPEGYNTTTL